MRASNIGGLTMKGVSIFISDLRSRKFNYNYKLVEIIF